jgi:hypothetical protein
VHGYREVAKESKESRNVDLRIGDEMETENWRPVRHLSVQYEAR